MVILSVNLRVRERQENACGEDLGVSGFNCSGANPLHCQHSKHENRTQWDWFLPSDSEEMPFPADRAWVLFLLIDDLEQSFGRPCHIFPLL